jgi:hypothetical protein
MPAADPAAPLGWVELYKVFEIVRDSAPKADLATMVNAGDLKAFTASANRPDISGSDARHARIAGDPPK